MVAVAVKQGMLVVAVHHQLVVQGETVAELCLLEVDDPAS